MRLSTSRITICAALFLLLFAIGFRLSPSEAAGKLTMAMYEQIKEGMSYEDVVRIIGWKGTEGSRVSQGGMTAVIYTWQLRNGSNLLVQFFDGKMTSKAQTGLK